MLHIVAAVLIATLRSCNQLYPADTITTAPFQLRVAIIPPTGVGATLLPRGLNICLDFVRSSRDLRSYGSPMAYLLAISMSRHMVSTLVRANICLRTS